jgi:hypothetical protein
MSLELNMHHHQTLLTCSWQVDKHVTRTLSLTLTILKTYLSWYSYVWDNCTVLKLILEKSVKMWTELAENIRFFFIYLLNQQSEYKVFYKLICWLGLVCRLTSVIRSPPARRSRRPCYRSAGHKNIRWWIFSKSGNKPLCSITTRNLMMKWIADNLSQSLWSHT